MDEVVIKHFRRANKGANSKELVTEIVVEGSDTGRFLKRMEDSRLTRPCYQSIDMRGRVAGECRYYAFNDRVHYLDDISFQMFERGLLENKGVYTVGTFEAIITGSHTIQAVENDQDEQRSKREGIEQRRAERAQATALEHAGDQDNDPSGEPVSPPSGLAMAENPPYFPLGYFRQRANPRLQYACKVTMERGNIRSNGVTRDLSVCGMQVRVKGVAAFSEGQKIMVSLDGLLQEADGTNLERIPYTIISNELRDAETVLRLRRSNQDKPSGFAEFFEQLIERHQRKYKLDIEDEYQSILSWCYERLYAESTTQMPFFVERDEHQALRIQCVAMSEGNALLTRFFCTGADNYNFTPLCLPQRLQLLDQGQSYVLAMYRQRGENDQCMRIHSSADFEFDSAAEFEAFVHYALMQSEHCIVKVQPGSLPFTAITEAKVDVVSQRLQFKAEARMSELRDSLEIMHLLGYVTDVTTQFKSLAEQQASAAASALKAWVGTECRDVQTGKVSEQVTMDMDSLSPQLVRFGYVERRREDRYLADTQVEVRIGKSTYMGMSKDISTRGIQIQLDKKIKAKVGGTVKVGLVSLQQKKSGTNLMDIPYRIIYTELNEGTRLRMERIAGSNQEGLGNFFVELITKNEHKLGVDVCDIWGATTSRIYESLLALNTPSIPFFLARSVEGGAQLQFVGLAESSNALGRFFTGFDGHDLRCLNESRIVSTLYDAVQIHARKGKAANARPDPFTLEMYVYKELDEVSGEYFIHSLTELDFSSDTARDAFFLKLPQYEDWKVVRIVSTYTEPLPETAFNKMIEDVRSGSKHRAIKLSEYVHAVVGYGELIDITDVWSQSRYNKPAS